MSRLLSQPSRSIRCHPRAKNTAHVSRRSVKEPNYVCVSHNVQCSSDGRKKTRIDSGELSESTTSCEHFQWTSVSCHAARNPSMSTKTRTVENGRKGNESSKSEHTKNNKLQTESRLESTYCKVYPYPCHSKPHTGL